MFLYKDTVNQPTAATNLSSHIADNPRFSLYFDDCIRALDGTHVHIHVPLIDQARYRNRKATLL
jgi:hypothetical protein